MLTLEQAREALGPSSATLSDAQVMKRASDARILCLWLLDRARKDPSLLGPRRRHRHLRIVRPEERSR